MSQDFAVVTGQSESVLQPGRTQTATLYLPLSSDVRGLQAKAELQSFAPNLGVQRSKQVYWNPTKLQMLFGPGRNGRGRKRLKWGWTRAAWARRAITR